MCLLCVCVSVSRYGIYVHLLYMLLSGLQRALRESGGGGGEGGLEEG